MSTRPLSSLTVVVAVLLVAALLLPLATPSSTAFGKCFVACCFLRFRGSLAGAEKDSSNTDRGGRSKRMECE
jgi:hypothetical protein